MAMTIDEIYRVLDAYAPFSLQESYDRSGLLVGDRQKSVSRILLTLDITIPVIREAAEKRADLIVSHHPVIWDPIRSIDSTHPVWHLVQHQIGAICSHTCMDIAEGGLNDYIGNMMAEMLPFAQQPQPFAELSGGRTLGRTVTLEKAYSAAELAGTLREVFRSVSLRYYSGQNADNIRHIAWCSGSGGDLIADASRIGADALITGDCKHSVWADAQNRAFTLFDCGHFETEVPVVNLFADILRPACPGIELLVSEQGTEPFFQV